MAKKRSRSKIAIKERKGEELLGILLIIFGVLCFIALYTYNHQEVPSEAQVGHVKNGLGIAGVYISYYLIHWTIGYPVFILPFLVVAWGINRFLGKAGEELMRWTVFIILISLFVSMTGALHSMLFAQDLTLAYRFSGIFGTWGAKMLQTVLGNYGAMVVLIGLIVVTVFMFTRISFAQIIQTLSGELTRFAFYFGKWVQNGFRALWHRTRQVSRFHPAFDQERRDKEPVVTRFRSPYSDDQDRTDQHWEDELERPQPDIDRQQAAQRRQMALDLQKEEPPEDPGEPSEQPKDSSARPKGPYVYNRPPVSLLQLPEDQQDSELSEDMLKANGRLLEDKLGDFDVSARVVEIHPGPVITRYELELAPGIKVSRITSLADDLAMAMRAKRIRIVAPIPGKAAVGIEIPNPEPEVVYLREILQSPQFQENDSPLTMAFGKTASGKPFTADLRTMPHLLVAGSTGSGKSVCLNTIIASILYKSTPEQVQFVLIDPKRLELSTYQNLYHQHLLYVEGLKEKVATSPKNAIAVLKSVEQEMERRYEILAQAGVRNIDEYNIRVRQGKVNLDGKHDPRLLYYLIVIVDELADLMMTSAASRDVEEPIARLTQMSRAVGIHLIVATQRPSVDVITGVIKANFPARIAFQVASKVDSRTILDMNGAEKLLGRGDMLFLPPASPEPVRLHNAFITLDEIEGLIDHVLHQAPYEKSPLPAFSEEQAAERSGLTDGGRDPLFWDALKVVVRSQQGSVSLLQRKLKVGYSRAARIVDELEDAGVVGPFEGSKARQVLMSPEELEDMGTEQEEDEF
jgi:S-DNA-T family DNA segregation ATPase FtsK/SpoIIIE